MNGKSSIPQSVFEHFKSLYLKDSSPSALACWHFAKQENPDIQLPAARTFIRRLQAEMGERAIAMHRLSPSKYSRKYGSSIKRGA